MEIDMPIGRWWSRIEPPHKPALEKHLKQRLGELFDLDYDLLLYDVTSTYFEGAAAANPQAQRGYSRDRRPHRKQVDIA
jgi:transposase